MSLPKMSFIVPYSHRSWCPDDNRLITLLSTLQKIRQSETVLHLSGMVPSSILNALQRFSNVVIVQVNQPSVYSAGQARNDATKYANGEYLFFVDVDLSLHPTLITEIVNCANSLNKIGIQAFEMFPCIYLRENIVWPNLDNESAFTFALEGLMRGKYSIVNGVALASSCLLVNRKWFEMLGGFDADFVGHGGEDLEFIHRLCLHYDAGQRPHDYAENKKSHFVANYDGFRKYFCCYALPHLFSKRFLVHHWHPRPLGNPYHRARKTNDNLLAERLSISNIVDERLNASISTPSDWDSDFQRWLIDFQEQADYPIEEYPGLFRLAENENIPRPIKNKIRKLILNPYGFFKDFLLNRIN